MYQKHLTVMSSFLLSLAGFSVGSINIDGDGVNLIMGSSAKFTCDVDPVSSPVSWNTDRYQTGGVDNTQTQCLTSGACHPPTSGEDPRYSFNASVNVGASGQYNMFISSVDCLDSAAYTCIHGAEKDIADFTVKVIPDSVLISDDGTTVVAETSCLFAENDIELKWYSVSVSTSENKTYTLPSNSEQNSTATGCPTDCGSTKVKVTFKPDKPSGSYTEVKFKVEVRHTANPAVLREATTANIYLLAGTTTTTATTASITTTTNNTCPTTNMTASSATATTTISVPTSMTSISTSTTKTPVSVFTATSTVTAAPTASSTVSSTNSTVKTPFRDKALVTMIIVVSVIGGVLVVAIFSIVFVMTHWKSCFTKMTHPKQYTQRSDHRKQHRQAENNANGRFFTTQQDHVMRDYYFYNGTYKNPLFCDSFQNSSNRNNYYPNQKNFHDPKHMSSHETYQYNYDGDYSWDLKDSY